MKNHVHAEMQVQLQTHENDLNKLFQWVDWIERSLRTLDARTGSSRSPSAGSTEHHQIVAIGDQAIQHAIKAANDPPSEPDAPAKPVDSGTVVMRPGDPGYVDAYRARHPIS